MSSLVRHIGVVHDFSPSKGYGFITVLSDARTDIKKEEVASASEGYKWRIFAHISNFEKETPDMKFDVIIGSHVTFTISEGKKGFEAIRIRDKSDRPFDFKKRNGVNLNVSERTRRVGLIHRWMPANYGWATDQHTGEQVFVKLNSALVIGQQIEYTLEIGEKGPNAVSVTGPNGAPICGRDSKRALDINSGSGKKPTPKSKVSVKRVVNIADEWEDKYD
eukprot:Tbor_TRINITY_DN4977_c0_g1::TRINITY_DN4977_c0_g1_i1::g.9936::m.9936